MRHSEEVRAQLAGAVAEQLRGGTLEVLGSKGEAKITAFFAVVELEGSRAHAILKSAPVSADVRPSSFRCLNKAGDVVLKGDAGKEQEIELPEVVKKGGVVTFEFNYTAPV